jgi:hypothetical protein
MPQGAAPTNEETIMPLGNGHVHVTFTAWHSTEEQHNMMQVVSYCTRAQTLEKALLRSQTCDTRQKSSTI